MSFLPKTERSFRYYWTRKIKPNCRKNDKRYKLTKIPIGFNLVFFKKNNYKGLLSPAVGSGHPPTSISLADLTPWGIGIWPPPPDRLDVVTVGHECPNRQLMCQARPRHPNWPSTAEGG